MTISSRPSKNSRQPKDAAAGRNAILRRQQSKSAMAIAFGDIGIAGTGICYPDRLAG
jgi:hypothetical protein